MFNLEKRLEKDFATTVWGEKLLQELEEELIDDILMLQEAKLILAKEPELDKFEKVIDDDIDMLQMLKINLDSWDKSYEIASNIKFSKWPTDKKLNYQEKDDAKAIRDTVKKKIKKKTDKILIFNSKEANQDIYDMYEVLKLLKNLILEFDRVFNRAKREKNILDFNDIEHTALKILLKENEDGKQVPSEVAKMYQEKFCEIAIDEYQDSNLVQEYILTSIQKNNNIFMVGDVKQSIYRFRQARPELFLEKYAKYKLKDEKKEKDNLKIKLFKNFRSRENILSFTNIIFENIMSNVLGDIDYNEDEYLNLGAEFEKKESMNLKTEISIIDLNEESANGDGEFWQDSCQNSPSPLAENTEIEAKFVANKIQNLINSHIKIYDTKNKEFRNIKYKDIVVLLRSTKDIANVYEKEILNLNMPVFCDTSAEYLDSIEIQTIMSVLKIIDNPLNDIALITCLRSPIGNFTDNDLVQIRLSDKYDNFYNTMFKAKLNVDKKLKKKIDDFINNINIWREEKEYLALDELIWKIYTKTGYYNYVGLMPNGNLRQANLKKLFEKAKQYESASFKGLFNFINFIEKLQLSSGDLGAAKLIGENEDVIRIMSIHKSKGLEFPIVFLAGTGKQFNLMDLNDSILMHHEMGFGVKYIDYEKQIQYDTLSKAALRDQLLQDTLSEEMRILYVAQTRAKEKLYITAASKDAEKEINDIKQIVNMYPKTEGKINPVIIKKYKRFIDWILLTSIYEKEKFEKLATIEIVQAKDIQTTANEKKENIDVIKILENQDENIVELKKVKELLESNYKYTSSIDIPTKTSVTRLKQMKQDPSIDNKNEISFAKPEFLRKDKDEHITSAQKGTLVHLCMQRLDYKKNYSINEIKELIQKLQAKQIITEKEAKCINPDKIYKFTQSSIWKEMQEAKEVYQEKPFYINIPAKNIYGENIEEDILVQGIIDLYYIDKNDNLILVDYKTDFVEFGKEAEIVNKYKEQLNLYSQALESALNKKVYKKYIYSTYLNKALQFTDNNIDSSNMINT